MPLLTTLEIKYLVDCLNRGGLTAVSIEFQRIFIKAEMQFRISTSNKKHLKNIDIYSITILLCKTLKLLATIILLLIFLE